MIYSLAVFAAILAVANGGLFIADAEQQVMNLINVTVSMIQFSRLKTVLNFHQRYAFDGFVRDYNRQYESVEAEAAAFKNFVENLKIADERNMLERQNNGTAIHGITKFSDISQEDFKKRYLNADISKKKNRISYQNCGPS